MTSKEEMAGGARPRRSSTRWWIGLACTWLCTLVALWLIHPSPYLSNEIFLAEAMDYYVAWWQRPLVVLALLLLISTSAYLLGYRLCRRRASFALALATVSLVGSWWGHRHLTVNAEQEFQSCANCRSFIEWIFEEYMEANDGWYPRGGSNEWDSLSRAIQTNRDVHLFTSHALAGEAYEVWERTGTLTDEVICYGYNEGFNRDDEGGMVLMYYEKAGYWECSHHRMTNFGRVVMHNHGGRFEFVPEAEFQAAQSNTLAYLARRKAERSRIEQLKSVLQLTPSHRYTPPNRYDITCEMRNSGERSLAVSVRSSYFRSTDGRVGSGMTEGPHTLEPGASFQLARTPSFEIRDSARDGLVYERRQITLDGSDARQYPGVPAAQLNTSTWVSVSARVRVTPTGEDAVEFLLNSPRHYHLAEDPPQF